MKSIAVIFIALGLGCTAPLPRHPAPAAPPAATGAAVQRLNASEAHTLIVNSYADERLVLLDVRTPEEFAEGHLGEAVNLDIRGADFTQRVERLDRSVPYLVYCGRGLRSAQAVAKMQLAGFQELYDLLGGLEAWIAAGYLVVK